MIDAATFLALRDQVIAKGYDDVDWAENIEPPKTEDVFAAEAIYVICNSGMKFAIARRIYDGVMGAIGLGRPVSDVFGHKGKVAAIMHIWRDRSLLFHGYLACGSDEDRLQYCATLPWIGEITKYHLAKNFGTQVAKPDIHLQRLADREGCTPQELCERLAAETGYKVPTVDTVLWRACALGILNSRRPH